MAEEWLEKHCLPDWLSLIKGEDNDAEVSVFLNFLQLSMQKMQLGVKNLRDSGNFWET